jgi:uncharacterized coiled-coil DUF342 family protein
MLSKIQVKYMWAMKVMENVLKGKDTDVAQKLVAKHNARVEEAGEYLEKLKNGYQVTDEELTDFTDLE